MSQSDDVHQQLNCLATPIEALLSREGEAVSFTCRTWMRDTFHVIGSRAITQLRCVGSHNSGTFAIDEESAFSPDAPSLLKESGCLGSSARCLLHGTTALWAKCQTLSLRQQLESGVRYLDLRVAPRHSPQGKKELMIIHGLYGASVAEVLDSITKFMSDPESSREFLIIDFQHIFCTPVEMEEIFFREVAPLLQFCVLRNNGLVTPLASLLEQDSQRRIFVFLGRAFDHDAHLEFFPRGSYVSSPWKNVADPDALLEAFQQDVNAALSTYAAEPSISTANNESPPVMLYVTQAICTPTASQILWHTASSCSCCCSPSELPLRSIARRLNPALLNWFCKWNTGVNCHDGLVPRSIGLHRGVLLLDHLEIGQQVCQGRGMELAMDSVRWCVYLNLLEQDINPA